MSNFDHMAATVLKVWASADGRWVSTDRRTKFVGLRELAPSRPVSADVLDPVNFRDKLWDRRPLTDLMRRLQLFAPDGRRDFPPQVATSLAAMLRPMAPLSWFHGEMSAILDREGNPAVLIVVAGPVPLSDRSHLVACGSYAGGGKVTVWRVDAAGRVTRTPIDWEL
jgi:hypothetical protein